MYIAVLANWGIGLTLAWNLSEPLGLGPISVWTGLMAGLTVAGLLLVWRFRRYRGPISAQQR